MIALWQTKYRSFKSTSMAKTFRVQKEQCDLSLCSEPSIFMGWFLWGCWFLWGMIQKFTKNNSPILNLHSRTSISRFLPLSPHPCMTSHPLCPSDTERMRPRAFRKRLLSNRMLSGCSGLLRLGVICTLSKRQDGLLSLLLDCPSNPVSGFTPIQIYVSSCLLNIRPFLTPSMPTQGAKRNKAVKQNQSNHEHKHQSVPWASAVRELVNIVLEDAASGLVEESVLWGINREMIFLHTRVSDTYHPHRVRNAAAGNTAQSELLLPLVASNSGKSFCREDWRQQNPTESGW